MPWDFWLIFLFLAVVIPWRGLRRLKQLMAKPPLAPKEKIMLYAATIAFQWLLAGIVAWRAVARGMTSAQLGLASGNYLPIILASVIGGLLLGLLHWVNLRRMGSIQNPAIEKFRELAAQLLPRTPIEFLPYSALAITAGICEEFVFRGFAMGALARASWNVTLIVIFTSVLFGLAHAYQGRGGIFGTALLGFLFAIGRLAYHSVVPVVVWHAALDLVAGVAGARYLLATAREIRE
jgi:membrane protease YdiL (CAAX protease family)